MEGKNFTEKDKEMLIQFLNAVATKAQFNMKTQDMISYVKLLSFMQQELLPKVNDHILEVKRVVEENGSE